MTEWESFLDFREPQAANGGIGGMAGSGNPSHKSNYLRLIAQDSHMFNHSPNGSDALDSLLAPIDLSQPNPLSVKTESFKGPNPDILISHPENQQTASNHCATIMPLSPQAKYLENSYVSPQSGFLDQYYINSTALNNPNVDFNSLNLNASPATNLLSPTLPYINPSSPRKKTCLHFILSLLIP